MDCCFIHGMRSFKLTLFDEARPDTLTKFRSCRLSEGDNQNLVGPEPRLHALRIVLGNGPSLAGASTRLDKVDAWRHALASTMGP